MTIRGHCPTPHKNKYLTLSFAEMMLISIKHRTGANIEIYECADHWHIRDKTKRKRNDRYRQQRNKERRKKYQQLTIFDWMKELNGA